jgi:hypothetical protein
MRIVQVMLIVGKALDKLRSNDARKIEQLDDKIKAQDEETQRLRAQRNRLRRDRGPGTIERS